MLLSRCSTSSQSQELHLHGKNIIKRYESTFTVQKNTSHESNHYFHLMNNSLFFI